MHGISKEIFRTRDRMRNGELIAIVLRYDYENKKEKR